MIIKLANALHDDNMYMEMDADEYANYLRRTDVAEHVGKVVGDTTKSLVKGTIVGSTLGGVKSLIDIANGISDSGSRGLVANVRAISPNLRKGALLGAGAGAALSVMPAVLSSRRFVDHSDAYRDKHTFIKQLAEERGDHAVGVDYNVLLDPDSRHHRLLLKSE